MSQSTKSTWNAESDRDLLLAIMELGKLEGLDWHAVSARMGDKGYSFSNEGCRQHYQKLRKAYKSKGPGPTTSPIKANGSPSKSTNTTPRKRAPKSTKSSQSTNGNSFASTIPNSTGDYEEDVENFQTPSKRPKMEAKYQKQGSDEYNYGMEKVNAFKIEERGEMGQLTHDLEHDE
ncbi:hypothetical protein BGZ60DRAFT_384043 [Tricladium varicosporioides]|nr:hypothetical protein BGZ60DRAFT_384043 [Hymenoscyphus varicosporioides]